MKQTFTVLLVWLCAASLSAQTATDLTSRLTNANFSNGTSGWTTKAVSVNSGSPSWGTLTGATPATVEAYAGWGTQTMSDFAISQEVTLEPGMYRLSGQAFYRWGSSYNSDVNNADGKGARSMAWLVAGDEKVLVMRLGAPVLPDLRPAGYANAMYEGAAAFAAGVYPNTLIFNVSEAGKVKVGYEGSHNRDQSWLLCGPLKLEQISEEVLKAEAEAALAAARTEYASIKAFFDNVANKHESDTPFDPATADALLAAATDVAAAEVAMDSLSAAFGRFLKTCNEKVDFTSFITNPSFETGTLEGWDCLHYGDQNRVSRTDDGIYAYSGTAGDYLFNTWRSGDGTSENHFIFQTLKHLPAGTYQLEAMLASNQSDADLTLRANDQTAAVKCSDKTVGVPGELRFTTIKPRGVRIGVASNRWFKVDDFHLYFFNDVYLLRHEAAEALRLYEGLASQAVPGEGHDEFVATIAALEAQLKQVFKKSEATQIKNQAHAAVMKLIETTPSRSGVYDVTSLINNPSLDESTTGWTASATPSFGNGVAEQYNNTGTFSLTQNLTNMPAGTYTLCVQSFYRTTSFTTSLEAYTAGTAKMKAQVKLSNTALAIKSIFDDTRYQTGSTSYSYLATYDASAVPNNMDKSNALFQKGLYWNTVRARRNTPGTLTISYSLASGGLSSNWCVFDNFRLFYGNEYTINLDTLTTLPLPLYGTVKSSRILHAGGLNAVCLPYQGKLDDYDAVYEVGKVTADGMTLIPAREMRAGRTYLVSVGTDTPLQATDVLLSAAEPDSIPLLWNGVHYVGTPYARKAPVAAYRLNADGTALEKVAKGTPLEPCEPLFYLPETLKDAAASLPIKKEEDWMAMNLRVNLENNQVLEYLAAADYPDPASQSIVEKYNQMDPTRRDHPRPVAIPIPAQEKRPTTQRLIYGTQPDFSDATRVNIARGGTVHYLFNLEPHQIYYYKVETTTQIITQGCITTEGRLRMIYTGHGSNIRDLGGKMTESGYRTRYGRIFRGGEMHAGGQTTLSDADIAELKRLGIGAEIDLRSDGEFPNGTVTYSALDKKAPYIYVNQVFGEPWSGDSPGDRATNLIEDTVKYRNLFNFLGEQCKANRNTYFHCIWGADRTGAFGVLVNGLLGVSRSDICKDYELTTFSKAGLRKKVLIETKLAYINTFPGKTLQERFYSYLSTYVKADKDNLDAIIAYMLNTDPDGIEDIPEQPATPARPDNNAVYDLQGRRISTKSGQRAPLSRGIYIVNGRKVAM